jgi:hypothetical protein
MERKTHYGAFSACVNHLHQQQGHLLTEFWMEYLGTFKFVPEALGQNYPRAAGEWRQPGPVSRPV